jgi:hypothetical protein
MISKTKSRHGSSDSSGSKGPSQKKTYFKGFKRNNIAIFGAKNKVFKCVGVYTD